MSNCVSKPISALSWATSPLTGEEILPIVQNGENKIIQIKDLACKGGHGGGACIAELKCEIDFIKELAKKAMQIADSAFKTACANDAKLAALEQIVNQHDTLICEIQRNIQNILNKLEALKDDLKVSISVTESSPNKNYVFNQGNDYVGTVFVPMVTSDLVETNGGMAADAAAVARKLPKKLSDLVNDLRFITFIEGKFNENDTQYNGSAARTIHIPVRTSQLINDGDQNGNNFLIGLKDYAGNDVPVSGGIADLSRNDLPVATANKLGAVKLGSDSRTAEGAPLKLNNQNQGMIAPAAADSYGTVKVGGTADATQKKFPVTLDGNGNAIVNLSTLPTGAETLNDLSDVQTTPQTGDVLYFDGTKWINKPISDLISENLDCQAIQDCFRTANFNVAPLVVTLEYNERIANFAVTSSGAWKIQKVTSGDNIFTASIQDNVHQNPGIDLALDISAGSDNTSGQDREVEWDVIPWITVPGLITTQRIKVIQKAQAAPPTPTDRTITYNISGGQTNSIKVNNEVVGNGGQKTAPDGSNYTVPIVSNDPGYKIKTVTPSVGTYNNGTLTINPITSDVTVQIVLEEIPAGTHNVTYVVDGDASKITNLPNSPVTVTNGQPYTYTPTIEQGYEIPTNGVTFNPNGNGSYDGTTITIPQGVTTDTTVTIRVVASSSALDVNPDIITVRQGQTTDTNITVSTTCTGGEYNARNLPTGITAVKQAGGFKVTVQSSVSAGQYQFEVYDNCGNTHTVTVNVQAAWLNNINLGVNGNQFNAFGVIEERFNANSSVAIDPAVSNPYQASTYTNGAATYDVNLGQGPSTDINYLKDHLYLRQQVVTGNEGGTDTSQYRETKLSDFDSSYEQKPSGSNYRYPFTADINLDGNNNVILSIACLPTDFADSDSIVITNTDNSTYSTQEVKGSYIVRALTLELMDDNDNIIDSTPSWDTNFSREIYCNKLFPPKSNNCYGISGYVTSSDTFQITSGYYQNNQDSTSDRTTPLAAWEVSNGKLGHSVVISPTTSSETADITKTGDVQTLEFTNLQDKQVYDLSVTTNSTSSSSYSSLTSEQLHWIYLSNFVFRMNFSSNISDFVNTSNSWLFTGSIKGRYPTAWGGGNRRSLTYLSVNTSLACEIDPLFSTSQGVDKYSQVVIEDLSAQVASSGISITQIDLLGNTVQGDVIDLTDPNDPHYGDTYDQVINEYCSSDQGHGCTSFAIVYENSNNERHISIQFLGVVSDVSVTLNS